MSLTNAVTRPSFQSIRPVDAVQLIATGMCFGVALVTLVMFLRGTRSG
jgi:hypothetical protein